LLELSQAFEKIARDSAQHMIASATDEGNKNLEEKAAEISSHFRDRLEGPCSHLSRIHWGID
jgi:F0F1-type ATP synthase membrane subunit b/b'